MTTSVINYSPHKGVWVPASAAAAMVFVSIVVYLISAWSVGAAPFKPAHYTVPDTAVGGKSLDPSYHYTPCVIVGNGYDQCLPKGKIRKDFEKHFENPIVHTGSP